jgi:hypothetical protein
VALLAAGQGAFRGHANLRQLVGVSVPDSHCCLLLVRSSKHALGKGGVLETRAIRWPDFGYVGPEIRLRRVLERYDGVEVRSEPNGEVYGIPVMDQAHLSWGVYCPYLRLKDFRVLGRKISTQKLSFGLEGWSFVFSPRNFLSNNDGNLPYG